METWEVVLPLTGSKVNLQLLKLDQSAYVWIGTEADAMLNLAVVLQTPYVHFTQSELPSVAYVLGDSPSDYERLLQRLCKKSSLNLHCSCNLAPDLLRLEPGLTELLERELLPRLAST